MKAGIRVRHNSNIVVTLKSGRLDIISDYMDSLANDHYYKQNNEIPEKIGVNVYYIDDNYTGKVKEFLLELRDAMNGVGSNIQNHDNSDIQTDYIDVGWYLDINVGDYDKPYIFIDKPLPSKDELKEPKYEELTTKTSKIDFIKNKIKEDGLYALQALLTIYYNNLIKDATKSRYIEHSDRLKTPLFGFSNSDEDFLKSLAEEYIKNKSISNSQLYWIKKKIYKYAKQILDSDDRNLNRNNIVRLHYFFNKYSDD